MTMQRTDRVVWAEIPVSDMARAKAFYASLLGAPLVDEDAGPNPLAMLPRSGEDGSVSGDEAAVELMVRSDGGGLCSWRRAFRRLWRSLTDGDVEAWL